MKSTYPEISYVNVLFEGSTGLYGALMLRLVALSISCVVLIKLPSIVCVLALVDMRWLSLCSFSRAKNVPGVAFTGISSDICILLFGDMLLMMP